MLKLITPINSDKGDKSMGNQTTMNLLELPDVIWENAKHAIVKLCLFPDKFSFTMAFMPIFRGSKKKVAHF